MKMIFHLIFSSEYPYSGIFEDLCKADVCIFHFNFNFVLAVTGRARMLRS